MRVSVDMTRCQGHACCYEFAPELFTVDDSGYSTIGTGKLVPPGQEEKARFAIKSCPERALSITED